MKVPVPDKASRNLDKHGFVNKSQELADEAIATAYRAGQLDRDVVWLGKLMEFGLYEIAAQIKEEFDNGSKI